MILAIDPGPVSSAWCLYDGKVPVRFAKQLNAAATESIQHLYADELVIEMIACYGMAVGAEVFETCIWIGRYMLQAEQRRPAMHVSRMARQPVKLHLCRSVRATDATIRQALIDRFGGKDRAIGKKAAPGPLYGMAGDCWAALALAVTAYETAERYLPPAERGKV